MGGVLERPAGVELAGIPAAAEAAGRAGDLAMVGETAEIVQVKF